MIAGNMRPGPLKSFISLPQSTTGSDSGTESRKPSYPAPVSECRAGLTGPIKYATQKERCLKDTIRGHDMR